MKKFFKTAFKPLTRFAQWILLSATAKKGDWMDEVGGERPAAKQANEVYDPDAEFRELATKRVLSPVVDFTHKLMKGEVQVAEAYVWEGMLDENGKLMPKKMVESLGGVAPYRTRKLTGDQFKESITKAATTFEALPARAAKAREAKAAFRTRMEALRKAGLIKKESFDNGDSFFSYDRNQYSEFTPTYGGPFNKQLYLYDYLTMHARAFEIKNHNPVAKRIIDLLSQYAFGKRFKARCKDSKKQKIWDKFNKDFKIVHRVCKFWAREYATYGEFMFDKKSMNSIDPSTVWDIITDPDDITKVYYYYQSYSTAFQTFTGMNVPGAGAGAKTAEPVRYIVRQIPAKQVIHIKQNVVSQEKRGRSTLFSILGWLKRLNDLMNAVIIRTQLQATFVWDDTIVGDQAAVDAHIAQYGSMPVGPSVFAHNEQVKRTPMAVLDNGGASRTHGSTSEELMCLIATGAGIPKQFLNLLAASEDSQATSLVSAEPFEKVIEELQADFENFLLELAEDLFVSEGLGYEDGDIEFMFPQVTKDTTTEAMANIAKSELLGYIDHRTACEMSATELGITNYSYDDMMTAIKKYNKDKPLNPFPGMGGGMFGDDVPGANGKVPRSGSGAGGLHGQPKNVKKGQLKK